MSGRGRRYVRKQPVNSHDRAQSTSFARQSARSPAACPRHVRAEHVADVLSELARWVFQPVSGARHDPSIDGDATIGRGTSTEEDPSRGDRASYLDALTRAIGREIQNGVAPRATRQLRGRRISRVSPSWQARLRGATPGVTRVRARRNDVSSA